MMSLPPACRSALATLAEKEGLPADFPESFARIWQPHLPPILARKARSPGMLVLALCGPQGSGKSTTAQALEILFMHMGARTAILSLDDLYLGQKERQHLAETIHPLLITRGPPGTHDAAMGIDLIDRLGKAEAVPMPRFDKAIDDSIIPAIWPVVQGPIDILIFEGWCVGARSQDDAALAAPVNQLEEECDPGGVWRRYVNDRLATDYAALFARIGYQILLQAPSFDIVTAWRTEQEHKLRARSHAPQIMDDAAVARFVQHYERLSRHIHTEMPGRADLVLRLDENRRPVS